MRLNNFSLIMALLSGLSGCSTTENTPRPTQSVVKPTPQAQTNSAEALFERALDAVPAMQFQLLYMARDAAMTSKNWPLLEQIAEVLNQKATVDQVQNTLYLAFAKEKQGKFADALTQLRLVESDLQSSIHRAWHQYLTGSIYASQGLPKQALPHFFNAADLVEEEKLSILGLDDAIWHALQQLSIYALERFDQGSVLQQGWVKLAKYQQVYVGKGVLLDEALNNWAKRYVNHPAATILPSEVRTKTTIEPYKVKRLAVLLPQSGSSERLGAALKNGILAALDENPIEEVYFLDEMADVATLEQSLTQLNIDFVIGPLLKSNVTKIQQSPIIRGQNVLFLNSEEVTNTLPNHFYFALNPEHEIDQALAVFLSKGFKKPMILAPQNTNGQRLVERFIAQWKIYSASEPEIGFYTDSKNMAKVVADRLEVDASKQRIKTIRSFFRQEIESETRSRADLDAIYILGDSTETRLLKPYLDVNVSTFADRIPLFATSRSHSMQIGATDKNDLDGLYFTEQPWMLPVLENRKLRESYDALWPEQADIEQRLFAMAVDAVKLIPELRQLASIPGREYVGLTGKLKVTTNNQLSRSLNWAQYKNDSIERVEFNEKPPKPLFMQEKTNTMVSLLDTGIND
ncbi:LppC putative lipoprotein [Pseudoalteromonas luteoviolacea B = ATCC 29581]|nr:LppC putative lipoprotein [Pseudoalteromonas luteoviolacea B = ATCC 29581]